MPTINRNNVSREDYIARITHPRKRQLATMILDGASVAELNDAGFGRLNIMEAARDIKRNVEGQENLSYDIPRGEGMDSTAKSDIERTASADDAEKKASPAATQGEQNSPASAPAQPAGDNGSEVTSDNHANMNHDDENKGDSTGSTEGQGHTTAPDGSEVPGVTADQSNVETLGGHPVGTLTGEEDAETLQERADNAPENAGGDNQTA